MKPQPLMKRLDMMLPAPMVKALEAAKRLTGLSKSEIMRRALDMWLAEQQHRNRRT